MAIFFCRGIIDRYQDSHIAHQGADVPTVDVVERVQFYVRTLYITFLFCICVTERPKPHISTSQKEMFVLPKSSFKN